MNNVNLELTVLCENSVAGPFGLIGEHGWSALVELRGRKILFDTGQGLGILNNATRLGKDLSSIDLLVLSHGHYDHASGIPQVASVAAPLTVICHPDVFVSRYWSKDGARRYIGMIHRRDHLESLGCRFKFYREFSEILPGIHVTGEVPRVTDFEPPDPHMEIKHQGENGTEFSQDPLLDDLTLVVDTPKGLLVLLGCAHAGLINILTHIKKHLPDKKIHTVIGGTHLGFADKNQFDRTLRELNAFQIERLGASHCTGLQNAARLYCELGDKFFHAAVGTKVFI